MTTRFRKSVKFGNGVKVNINKKSVSITGGVKGAHHTISTNGKRTTTVGIPGSGLSYTSTRGGKSSYAHSSSASSFCGKQEKYTAKSPQVDVNEQYKEIIKKGNFTEEKLKRYKNIFFWLTILEFLIAIPAFALGGLLGFIFVILGLITLHFSKTYKKLLKFMQNGQTLR